jgi:hypothetical protein
MAGEKKTKNNDTKEKPIDAAYWETFNDTSLVSESEYIQCKGPSGSLAGAVCSTFNISCRTPSVGGNLTDIDIKRMDALTVINLSLLEESATDISSWYEAIVNESGQVEFVNIGKYSGDITHEYYSIQTTHYKEDPAGVMVTGKRPVSKRVKKEWKPIWGTSGGIIYTFGDMIDNCRKSDFCRHATIVYPDPHLESSYADGIDNLYDINDTNPWNRILGYAHYKEPPAGKMTDDTKLTYSAESTVPIRLSPEPGKVPAKDENPNMGNIQDLVPKEIGEQSCWQGTGTKVKYTDGVKVEIPAEFRFKTIRDTKIDNFIKVSGVYLVGQKADLIYYGPKDNKNMGEKPSDSNSLIWVTMLSPNINVFRLEEGRHYAVAYNDATDFKTPYIVFAKDKRKDDPFAYGKDTTFKFTNNSHIKDTEIGKDQKRTLFPTTKSSGVIVAEIWVLVDLEVPSIQIYDPDGEKSRALEIAENMKYYISPIIVNEEPAPIGFCGKSGARIIKQKPLKDNDPTTAQAFDETDLEKALDEMQGSGLTVSFSFLAEGLDCQKMACVIYNSLNSDIAETVYVCGPECHPKLGGRGRDGNGIVNAIKYAYTDQGSYTVSVTEGPKIIGGFSQIDGGATQKMTEDFQARGTVIATRGDNITFKVRMEGYGERWAFSMTHDIIRIGDVVNVAVHNNPVEA